MYTLEMDNLYDSISSYEKRFETKRCYIETRGVLKQSGTRLLWIIF